MCFSSSLRTASSIVYVFSSSSRVVSSSLLSLFTGCILSLNAYIMKGGAVFSVASVTFGYPFNTSTPIVEMTSAANLSPNMKLIRSFVEVNFADRVTGIGIYNRRPIAGTTTWSQHSWPNAIDIHVAQKRDGDLIFATLLDEFGDHLYEKLWWVSGHYDHIHVSTWPRGVLTPPERAGDPVYIQYERNGSIRRENFPLTIKEDDDLAILTDAEQLELQNWLRRLKAAGSNVAYISYLIPELKIGLVNVEELRKALKEAGVGVSIDDVIDEIVTRLED